MKVEPGLGGAPAGRVVAHAGHGHEEHAPRGARAQPPSQFTPVSARHVNVQHAGVVYGSGTIAHSYYKAPHPHANGTHADLWVNREVTALTGACIAVRREVFEDVGGFTEQLPVNYNDVDFCLKIGSRGLRLVWLCEPVIFHFESFSRDSKVHAWEKEFMAARWGHITKRRERHSMGVR